MNLYYRGAAASLAIAIISACGVVAPPGPNGLTLDVSKTNPPPNFEGVGITQSLVFGVLEDLETSSVSPTTVHLMPGQGHDMVDAGDDGSDEDMMMLSNDPIPAQSVTYDPINKTITFIPRVAMDQGRKYHIHANGIQLKGGKQAQAGIDTIQYSFTTAHSHEYYRKEYNDDGFSVAEERFTDTNNNVRAQRTQYEYQGGVKTLDYVRHYGAHHNFNGLNTGDEVLSWQQDGGGSTTETPLGGIQRYEVKRRASDGKEYRVRVRFQEPYPQSANIATDPVRNVWTSEERHVGHLISYQYEPINRGDPWPTSGRPATDPTFQLDDASLMEMNHGLPAQGNTTVDMQFQHRHIFYGSLGGNKQIDFNGQQNPQPIDDEVRVYHTRDLSDYLRTHEWSWLGKGRDGIEKYGADNQIFTNDDLAYRLRVYIYDTKGRRIQRVTYQTDSSVAPYGLTRTDWQQVLTQSGYKGHQLSAYGLSVAPIGQPVYPPQYSNSATTSAGTITVKVHSYRVYEYENDTTAFDPATSTTVLAAGGLKKVTVWHENSTDTALFKEQERYYTTQSNTNGKQMAQSQGLTF